MTADQCQRRRSLRSCRARPEARHNTNRMQLTLPHVPFCALTKRSKGIRLVSVQLETWGRDADNGIALSVQNKRKADGQRVSCEAALPETVAQDDHGRGTGAILFGQEDASS